MKITESQVDRFIALYKSEYGTVLERIEALKQIHALLFLVAGMLPDMPGLEIYTSPEYNILATNKVREGDFNDEGHKEG